MKRVIGAFLGFCCVFGIFIFVNWGIDFGSMQKEERLFMGLFLIASLWIGALIGEES